MRPVWRRWGSARGRRWQSKSQDAVAQPQLKGKHVNGHLRIRKPNRRPVIVHVTGHTLELPGCPQRCGGSRPSLEQRGPGAHAGGEAGAHAVAGELGIALYQQTNAMRAQGFGRNHTAFGHRPEDRARRDAGINEPILEGLDRTGLGPTYHGDNREGIMVWRDLTAAALDRWSSSNGRGTPQNV